MNNAEVWRVELQIRTKLMYARITKKKTTKQCLHIEKHTKFTGVQSLLKCCLSWTVGRLLHRLLPAGQMLVRSFDRSNGWSAGWLVGQTVMRQLGRSSLVSFSHTTRWRYCCHGYWRRLGGFALFTLFYLFCYCPAVLIGFVTTYTPLAKVFL